MPAPLSLAMVICDAVYRDPATGKMTILGTFTALHAREFPLVVPQITVYLALTDARGKVPLKFLLIDADEDRDPVYRQELEVDFPDPIAVMDLVLMLGGVVFPLPGEYRLQLHADGEFVIERRIVVVDLTPKQEQP